MVTKEDILDSISSALDEMVDMYNLDNDAEVVFDGTDSDSYSIDGGDIHGAWTVHVTIEPI